MQSGTTSSLGGSPLPVREAQMSFDVSRESDVIALLKFIHQNPIDPEVKNSIRDYVFAYRQDFSSTSFVALSSVCATVGISLAPLGASGVPVVMSQVLTARFNAGRPLPSFRTVVVKKELVEEPAMNQNGVNAVPLRKIVVPTFEVAPVVPPEPPQPVEVEQPVVTVAPVVEIPVPPVDLSALQARISEIKHAVNAKVGNPVNLIDAHNEVGRAYMNALLDAMKKANGGVQGELALAMAVLEDAYGKVLQALEGTSTILKQPAVVTPAVSTLSPKEVVQQKESPAPIVVQAAVKESTPEAVPTAQNTPVLEAKHAEQNSKVQQAQQTPPVVNPRSMPEVTPLPVPSYSQQKEVIAPEPSVASRPQRSPVPQSQGMQSVAKNKQLQDLLRSNREKELTTHENTQKEEIAKMDPILTPEVTAGLLQLLSEWSLFRSSGFFGTGPSGKDHVLYQKLAGLTMASVIAGRFEGATPLIKQSIGDYMNGWRYEEGIIHEHGETFEHYLRKVVYHIIEKKKKAILSQK